MTRTMSASVAEFPSRVFVAAGALSGLAAVMLGALGAHALKDILQAHDGIANFDRVKLYLFMHGLALIGVGLHCKMAPGRVITAAGAALLIGSVLFQGSLLVLSVTGWRPISYVTPFGGVSLMVGWLLWAVAGWWSVDRSAVREPR